MADALTYPPILDDLPTGTDELGFQPYIDALSDILLDAKTRTPLTLGLFGSWGSGKTSLMTMLRDLVAADERRDRTVWFNAWKYNHEDALWRALLLLLLDDLEQLLAEDPPPEVDPKPKGEPSPQELLDLLREALYHETAWSEMGERNINWGQALTAGAGLGANLALSFLGPGLAAAGMARDALAEARKEFGKGAPVSKAGELAQAFRRQELVHYQAQLRSLEQFQHNFRALVTVLLRREGEEARRLVVFVDDLDRCLPEKAMSVLEALKLFLDVEGCIFVLALDDEAIERAVRVRYKGEVKAREYLEKIIQLPFILPPIEDEAMHAYVESLAPHLPDARCAQVFAVGLPSNPRQVKRTLNMFLLLSRLVAHKPDLGESITPVRLAKIMAIQHAHPDFYNLLRVRPGYLRELEAHFWVQAGEGRGAEGRDGEAPPDLPEALQTFSGREALRRLMLCVEDEDARFDTLDPTSVRSYITLARQTTPAKAPAIHVARLPFEPELVQVAAGPFLMGTSEEQVKKMLARYEWAKEFQEEGWFDDEQPQHEVTLDAYEIGRYPVTNAEYAAFVEAAGHSAPNHWDGGRVPEGLTDHPVVYIFLRDAAAYVQWLAERTDQPYRLPTEAEWEKAARGEDGRLWPWGNEWNASVVNCKPGGPGGTTPVDQYPDGVSPYGCHDMAGNVWEWCSTIYKGYPYQADDGREQLDASGTRILRGGYWSSDAGRVRCASRLWYSIDVGGDNFGFRVARGSLSAP